MTSRTEERCRSCGAPDLAPILSLGRMPLANALLAAEDLQKSEPLFPLDLARCPRCTLVQITETVDPEVLFGSYLYLSSYSDTMLRHAAALADEVTARKGLGPRDLVVELASNDGYLLQNYAARGVRVLGIEPAANVAEIARQRGVDTLEAFFGASLGRELAEGGRAADVIHAHNVLAHVADLNGFVAGIAALLGPEGVAVIEVPYVLEMVRKNEFDTIYHEHLCYFGLGSLLPLFERHSLCVQDVQRVDIHGGSLRLFVGHGSAHGSSAHRLHDEETHAGLTDGSALRTFADDVRGLRERVREALRALRAQGRRIAGYGAAAKATVLLNYLGLPAGTLEFVVDRNPLKQGRWIPGCRVQVLPPEALEERRPDYLLILAWNIAAEVMQQQAAHRSRGGRFLVAVPDFAVLEP